MGLGRERARARERMETQAEVCLFLARGGQIRTQYERPGSARLEAFRAKPRSRRTIYAGQAHVRTDA
jgi:hypothetical protein